MSKRKVLLCYPRRESGRESDSLYDFSTCGRFSFGSVISKGVRSDGMRGLSRKHGGVSRKFSFCTPRAFASPSKEGVLFT